MQFGLEQSLLRLLDVEDRLVKQRNGVRLKRGPWAAEAAASDRRSAQAKFSKIGSSRDPRVRALRVDSHAAEPIVRSLFAGGSEIRTLGPRSRKRGSLRRNG